MAPGCGRSQPKRGPDINEPPRPQHADVPEVVDRLLKAASRVFPAAATALLGELCEILGARTARLFVADHSLHRLQQLDADGPVGDP